MHPSRRVLGFALLLLLVPAAQAGEGDLLTRLYDVGPLLQPDRPAEVRLLGLAPVGFELPVFEDDEEDEDEPQGFLEGDALVELVLSGVSGGWDEDERTRIALEGRRLLVRAGADAHEQVRRLLDALWTEAGRRIAIEGRHLLFDEEGRARLAAQGLIDNLRTGRVDARTRDALVAAASVSSAASTILRPGAQGTLGQLQATTYVRDYVVEIAQNSVVGDPLVDTVETGWFVSVTPHLLQGGDLLLDALIQTARLDEPIRRQALEAEPFGTVELPTCRALRLATAARVKAGESLVLGAARSEDLLEVLILTPALRGDPASTSGLRRWDLSALTGMTQPWRLTTEPPNFVGTVDAGALNPPRFLPQEPGDPLLSMDDLVEAIGTGLGDEAWEREDAWLAQWGRALVARNDDAALVAIDRFVSQRERALGAVSAHLRLLEIEGDRAEPRATATLPLPHGRSVVWQAGVERAYVADWGVEVAQEARTGEPQIAQVFGGLAFEARLDPAPTEGLYALSLDLLWVDLDETMETRRMGNECTGVIDVPRAARIDLHTDLVGRPGAPHRVDVGTLEDGRRLVVEITLLP